MDLHPFGSEAELVAALILGDPQGAEVFVKQYAPMIYGIARQEFRLSDADARDLFQSVFERLYEQDFRRLRRWNGRGSLKGFLRVLVRNLLLDRLRAAPPPVSPDGSPEDIAVWNPADGGDDEDARAECVRSAIDRLQPRDRRLIRRRHWDEASYREIAEAEDMTVNNVGVALMRAERRLAAWIQRLCADLIDRFVTRGGTP